MSSMVDCGACGRATSGADHLGECPACAALREIRRRGNRHGHPLDDAWGWIDEMSEAVRPVCWAVMAALVVALTILAWQS